MGHHRLYPNFRLNSAAAFEAQFAATRFPYFFGMQHFILMKRFFFEIPFLIPHSLAIRFIFARAALCFADGALEDFRRFLRLPIVIPQ